MFALGQLTFGWRDLLDILIVAILCYYGIRFVRGTRAMAALNGLLFLLVLYAAAQFLGLFTLVWFRLGLALGLLFNIGWLFFVAMSIIGIVNVCNGEKKDLPLVGALRFIKK